jgi:hypothetical protein
VTPKRATQRVLPRFAARARRASLKSRTAARLTSPVGRLSAVTSIFGASRKWSPCCRQEVARRLANSSLPT